MESEKRKRPDDDVEVDDGKKAKREDVKGKSVVSEEEEEVEEFFAILKRIHVAVKYFEKANNGGGRKLTTKNEWKPSFLLQDFREDNDVVKNDEKPEDVEEESGNLDLNLEPASKERRTD